MCLQDTKTFKSNQIKSIISARRKTKAWGYRWRLACKLRTTGVIHDTCMALSTCSRCFKVSLVRCCPPFRSSRFPWWIAVSYVCEHSCCSVFCCDRGFLCICVFCRCCSVFCWVCSCLCFGAFCCRWCCLLLLLYVVSVGSGFCLLWWFLLVFVCRSSWLLGLSLSLSSVLWGLAGVD